MKQKLLILLTASALSLTLFAGCGQKTADISAIETDTIINEPTIESTDINEPTIKPTEEVSTTQETREIIDMAGRTVTIPNEIETVFSASPIAGIYLYTLVPDQLLGWNYELNNIERSIVLEKYHNLPNFGMGDAVNYEAIIAASPSIALSIGNINDGSIETADQLSQKLGVPVIMVNGDLNAIPEAYRFMGELFDANEQAEKLAIYTEKTFSDIAAANIPENEKVTIYYGNGETSLETAPADSIHAQIIEAVNAINVADLELGDGSRIQISAEQLLAWNPDFIIVNGEPKSNLSGSTAADAFKLNPDFATLKAVQDNHIYGAPNAPFSWVDRPPASNRVIGMRWLSKLLYPDYFDYDMDDEVREFFNLFYHVDLTDEQLNQLQYK